MFRLARIVSVLLLTDAPEVGRSAGSGPVAPARASRQGHSDAVRQARSQPERPSRKWRSPAGWFRSADPDDRCRRAVPCQTRPSLRRLGLVWQGTARRHLSSGSADRNHPAGDRHFRLGRSGWLLARRTASEWPWRLARAGATGPEPALLPTSGASVRSSTETILASLNIHGGRDADGRRYDLEAACRQFKADIIVLQEVWRPHDEPDPVDELAAALGAEPLWTELIRDVSLDSFGIAHEQARGRWGLATLTTAPVL